MLHLSLSAAWLPDDVRARLRPLATRRDELVVAADNERSAHRNKRLAYAKLRDMLVEAGVDPGN